MKKTELYAKLSSKEFDKLTREEIDYLKNKISNDKLGLKLDFTELDKEDLENYFVLREEESLGINVKKDQPNNLLIEGDNYHALKALKAAGVRVDIIYIDPPYNTGKEFVYKDDFGTPQTVGSDDPHKHSKWLSFMKKRLDLAKELLSDEGVIFVSIDDNEQAYLKVLMDEIFGEENFVANFAVKTPNNTENKFLLKNMDYLVVYSKNIYLTKFNFDEVVQSGRCTTGKDDQNISNITFPAGLEVRGVEDGEYSDTEKTGGNEDIELISGKIVIKDGKIVNDITLRARWSNPNDIKQYIEKFVSKSDKKIFNKFNKELINLWFKGLRMQPQMDKIGYDIHDSIWTQFTKKGSDVLVQLFGKKVFDYPKHPDLIKYISSIGSANKNCVVLDFFAGSGTTGQAVMELNAADGGHRRFILITNNEMSGVDTKLNPEKGIARAITRERLFRLINEKGSDGKSHKWTMGGKLKNNSVSYLSVEKLHKVNGEYESIDSKINFYKREFNKEISIEDFE